MTEKDDFEMTAEDRKILNYIQKENLSVKDLKLIQKQRGFSPPSVYNYKKLAFNAKRVKFAVFSDPHIGHKNFREDILDHLITYSKKQHCEFALLPGDILEGMSGREGHIYELDHIGATNQIKEGVRQLNKFDMPVYGITATNSHDGWYSSKNNMGFEVGPELEAKVKNFNFIGYDEADVLLDSGLRLRMRHPGDGTAYAISYKLQKYLNSMSGGDKPHCLFDGHYHKAMYMFNRNVHAFESGCLEEQTIFMKKKGTPAMLGYWIIDVAYNKKKDEVDRIRQEFVPFY